MVKVPLTFTVFVPPANPVEKVPELLTLPVTERVVFDVLVPESSRSPALAMLKVPPFGVTVVVWLFCKFKVPATVVRLANPFVDFPLLTTFNLPSRTKVDPAKMSVTP